MNTFDIHREKHDNLVQRIIALCHVLTGVSKETLYDILCDDYPTCKIDYELTRLCDTGNKVLKKVGNLYFPKDATIGAAMMDLQIEYIIHLMKEISDA